MGEIEEIVHIVPLGHEVDRAVKPFESYKANKVYILAVTETFGKYSEEMVERQKCYVGRVFIEPFLHLAIWIVMLSFLTGTTLHSHHPCYGRL